MDENAAFSAEWLDLQKNHERRRRSAVRRLTICMRPIGCNRQHKASNSAETAEKQSRRQTKFLFPMVAVELLKDVMNRSQIVPTPSNITKNANQTIP